MSQQMRSRAMGLAGVVQLHRLWVTAFALQTVLHQVELAFVAAGLGYFVRLALLQYVRVSTPPWVAWLGRRDKGRKAHR